MCACQNYDVKDEDGKEEEGQDDEKRRPTSPSHYGNNRRYNRKNKNKNVYNKDNILLSSAMTVTPDLLLYFLPVVNIVNTNLYSLLTIVEMYFECSYVIGPTVADSLAHRERCSDRA